MCSAFFCWERSEEGGRLRLRLQTKAHPGCEVRACDFVYEAYASGVSVGGVAGASEATGAAGAGGSEATRRVTVL